MVSASTVTHVYLERKKYSWQLPVLRKCCKSKNAPTRGERRDPASLVISPVIAVSLYIP